MRHVEVRPNLLVTRHGGSSALVRDTRRDGMIGRRAGFISDATITSNSVQVTWLDAAGQPGRRERVSVHRLTSLGELYQSETAIEVHWSLIAPDRLQGAWLFPGLETQAIRTKPRLQRRPRRKANPQQLELIADGSH